MSPEDALLSTVGPWDGAGGSLSHSASGSNVEVPADSLARWQQHCESPASGDKPSPVQTVWRRSLLGGSLCCLHSGCPTEELGLCCLDMC